ncbi:hypothetical protein CHARACLAT_026206 [Characodon lateralis]|uniref:Uncharacterized protein n=1 Tax=Characodon lateralis TaxID=208331 RepID=A0ABU7EEU9_9TELE|nr:hypothetical protein [Characodon lateralis]
MKMKICWLMQEFLQSCSRSFSFQPISSSYVYKSQLSTRLIETWLMTTSPPLTLLSPPLCPSPEQSAHVSQPPLVLTRAHGFLQASPVKPVFPTCNIPFPSPNTLVIVVFRIAGDLEELFFRISIEFSINNAKSCCD